MNQSLILKELKFKAARSSGAGGQHVNKVSTKVILQFDLLNSFGLSEHEKEILQKKLINKLTKEGLLILSCAISRSQHKNKKLIIIHFLKLLKENLKINKARRLTNPTRSSIIKKIENKKRHSLKKDLRKKPKF